MFNIRSFLLLGCCVLLGCGGGAKDNSVPVNGKLTIAGQPLKVEMAASGAGWVELRFYPLDAAGAIGETYYQCTVTESGDFNVLGPSNHGLPPGKYKIVARQWDPYPTTDKLGDKFSEQNSPLTREISGSTKIELDLAKP